MSAMPNLDRAVESFDHPGLFIVRLDRPRAMPAAEQRLPLSVHERPVPAGATPTPKRELSARHRYCSACSHETEHVRWPGGGRANIAAIRWPAAEPASGTTICLDCGQWRAVSQAGPPAPSKRRQLRARMDRPRRRRER